MQFECLTPTTVRARPWRWVFGLAVAGLAALMPAATESAIANGDTRTLNLVHAHTHETISATYMVNGQYDQSVLDKLNWFLRDWRRDEPTKMDPRLFDTVWEVYRESGSQQPIMVMSAYRSPETNAMLRRRSRTVAEHSQHILGRAMDQHYMDVPMSKIRELGMRLQRGGVGFYPTAGTPFVHLDVGGVRHWPRMTYDQLARLFPDGKTVHIPSNGQPLPGYELARAELEARGDGNYPTATQVKSKSFFAWLFGGSDEEEDDASAGIKPSRSAAAPSRVASLSPSAADSQVGSYGKNASDRAGGGGFFDAAPPRTLFSSAQPASQAAAPQPVPAAEAPQPAPLPPPPSAAPQATVALAVPPTTPQPQAVEQPALRNIPVAVDLPALPLPPRRPTDLPAVVEQAAPLPPSRPTELLASRALPHDAAVGVAAAASRPGDAIGALLTGSHGRFPDVITQGGAGKPPQHALGYAAAAALANGSRIDGVPMPVARPSDLLSTRLDRSNFRSLTRPEATERSSGRSALGPAVPPLRGASRGNLGALTPSPIEKSTSFQARATDLSTDSFSGQVVKPTARAGTDRTNVD